MSNFNGKSALNESRTGAGANCGASHRHHPSWLRTVSRPIAAAMCLSMLGLLAGCGDSSKLKLYPVHGKVLFGGEPVAGALVVLHSTGKPLPDNIRPNGSTDSTGAFSINGYGDGDGAPAGEYVATVQWFKVIEQPSGPTQGPNVIPAQYAKPETSPLKFKVEEKPNDLPPFEIPQ